jgi:hypothetical protein
MTEILAKDWVATPGSVLTVVGVVVWAAAMVWHVSRSVAKTRRLLGSSITGTVEDDGGGPAAKLTVDQELIARDGWADWRETSRNRVLRDFTLITDSGERISVQHGGHARLWWPLEQTESLGDKRRRRSVEVGPGRRVTVAGLRLSGVASPFRDTQVAVPRGEMVLMAPELPATLDGDSRRTRLEMIWKAVPTCLLAVSLTLSMLLGTPSVGDVLRVQRDVTDVARIDVDTPQGMKTFTIWNTQVGARVPITIGPWSNEVRLGNRPALPAWQVFGAVAIVLLASLGQWVVRSRRPRSWWERDCIDESATVL